MNPHEFSYTYNRLHNQCYTYSNKLYGYHCNELSANRCYRKYSYGLIDAKEVATCTQTSL